MERKINTITEWCSPHSSPGCDSSYLHGSTSIRKTQTRLANASIFFLKSLSLVSLAHHKFRHYATKHYHTNLIDCSTFLYKFILTEILNRSIIVFIYTGKIIYISWLLRVNCQGRSHKDFLLSGHGGRGDLVDLP